MRKIVKRRVIFVKMRKSLLLRVWEPWLVRINGKTRWLDTIVASAKAATMTIEVADENPPRKARMARPS